MYISCTDKELFIFEKIALAAKELQVPAYVVGGFVRDKILGRPSKDMDIVCVGDGIALAKRVASMFDPVPYVSFFKNYGTAQLKFPGTENQWLLNNNTPVPSPPQSASPDLSGAWAEGLEIEFVGARKESYQANSRNPAVENGTLEDDQHRRDFTINAMAISLNEADFGSLIDPFDGLKHLEKKIICTPMEPEKTFSDDPLRMMRAIRFATQLQFNIKPETFEAIKENKDRIKIISGERIADELNKILLSPKPSIGFDLLYKSGLLQLIFPQMVALAGAENIDGMGHKDNFYHTLQVVDNIAQTTNDLWLRWAAVLHDIAKPATKRFEEGHGFTFHGHEVLGGRMVPKIFAQLKLPQNEKMRFVKRLVELHLRPISLSKEEITDSAIRRLLYDAGDDFDALMLLCEADITSKNKQKVKRYHENFELVRRRCAEVEEKDSIRNWQPPISGELIMQTFKLPPSKPVGIIKDAIRNAILDGHIGNDYAAAHAYMLKIAGEMGLDAMDKD